MTVHPYSRIFTGKAAAPTVNDDTSLGYEVGDIWIDETGDKTYQAVDITDGAAVWIKHAGQNIANTFTAIQKINVNSTTALLVEQDGVKYNVLVVDTTNGRVGVGTPTPSTTFEVGAGANFGGAFASAHFVDNTLSATVNFQNINAAGYTAFDFFGSDNSTRKVTFAWSNPSAGVLPSTFWFGTRISAPMYLQTNGTNRMTIYTDGKVAIGNLAIPTAPLHVYAANASIQIQDTAATANGSAARMEGMYAGGYIWYFGKSDTTTGDIALLNRLNGNLDLWTNTVKRVTINNNGGMTITGGADRIQSRTLAHSTQTALLATWETSAAAVVNSMSLTAGTVLNEQGDAAIDFRVESDAEANMIFLDSNGDTDGALYLGGTTNGIKINKGGELTLLGTATVWKDIDFPILIRTTGAGIPTLVAINGNLTAPQWAVNDFNMCESQEFIHEWKEASEVFWHCHLTTNGLDTTNRYVRFEIEYGYVDPNGVWTFPATIDTGDLLIPANTPNETMFILSLGSFTPAAGTSIGGHVLARLKRIASTGTAPTNNPWVPMLQLHVECDTFGSRTISAK